MTGAVAVLAASTNPAGTPPGLTLQVDSYAAEVTRASSPSASPIRIEAKVISPVVDQTLVGFSIAGVGATSGKIVQYGLDFPTAGTGIIYLVRWDNMVVGEQLTNTYQVFASYAELSGSQLFTVTLTRVS